MSDLSKLFDFQPDNPQDIKFPNKFIIIDEYGNKIEIPFGELELKGKDYIFKNRKDGKWYLQRMHYETFEIKLLEEE